MSKIIKRAHLPQNTRLRDRTRRPRRLVYHTTGGGLAQKAQARAPIERDVHAFDRAAVDWYRRSGFRFTPLYLVGQGGTVFELADPKKVTLHVASLPKTYQSAGWNRLAGKKPSPHGRDPKRVYDWWYARWPNRRSPLELMPDGTPHVNSNSMAIDVIPHPKTGRFSSRQMQSVVALAKALSQKHGIPPRREYHLGHEDLHPMVRGTVRRSGKILGVPWDPGKNWDWRWFMGRLGGSMPEAGSSGANAAAAITLLVLLGGAFAFRGQIAAKMSQKG